MVAAIGRINDQIEVRSMGTEAVPRRSKRPDTPLERTRNLPPPREYLAADGHIESYVMLDAESRIEDEPKPDPEDIHPALRERQRINDELRRVRLADEKRNTEIERWEDICTADVARLGIPRKWTEESRIGPRLGNIWPHGPAGWLTLCGEAAASLGDELDREKWTGDTLRWAVYFLIPDSEFSEGPTTSSCSAAAIIAARERFAVE